MKTFRPFIVIALAGFALSSCGLFPPARTGDVSVQLGFPDTPPAQAKGISPASADAIGIAPGPQKAFDPATTRIVLTVSGEDMEPIVAERDYDRESGTVYLKAEGVPVGERFLTLEAYDVQGASVTYGQASVFVAGGENNVAVVNMVPTYPQDYYLNENMGGTIYGGMRIFYLTTVTEPGPYTILLTLNGNPSNLFAIYDVTGAKIQLPATSLDLESPTRGRTPDLAAGLYYLSITSALLPGDNQEIPYDIYMFSEAYNPQ